jgi:hypothetical protein
MKFGRSFLVGRVLRTAPRKGLRALPIYAVFIGEWSNFDLYVCSRCSNGQKPGGYGSYESGIQSPKSTLATAIAAIPSPRPMNPIISFVVALTPICFSVTPRALAMCFFMAAICG